MLLMAAVSWTGLTARGATIPLPNASFESPATPFADPRTDAWQKAAEPAWYQGGGGFPWDQLVGQFLNTTNGSADHIDNMEGSQAIFLFALPEVAVFQDYDSVDFSHVTPGHEFAARFEPGKSYALTVGVLGSGGGMLEGATFELSLYYRDGDGKPVVVSSSTVTNSKALFPTNTHFVDFQTRLPIVQPTDAWANQHIGIRLASTVGFDLKGGYWDIDQVRLTSSVVPNPSFESPETAFADPRMDYWVKAPEPAWYQGGGGFPWVQLFGQFLNTTNGSASHIDNIDGSQAAFLFALPDAAIFQDYDSGTPHAFDVVFQPGKAYSLAVGAIGGGGGMKEGVPLEISLYYSGADGKPVTVAATTVTNTAAGFPTTTHFIDVRASAPVVQAGDAWAGKHVGIQIASKVGFDIQGGYWDLDNVRLDILTPPTVHSPRFVDGKPKFAIDGDPGVFEVLASGDPTLGPAGWTSLGTIVNYGASVDFTDPNPTDGPRFYRVRQSP